MQIKSGTGAMEATAALASGAPRQGDGRGSEAEPPLTSARATRTRGDGRDSASSRSAPSDLVLEPAPAAGCPLALAAAHFMSAVSSVSKSRYSAPVGWKRSSTPSSMFCTEIGVVSRPPGRRKPRAKSCRKATASSAVTAFSGR
eukprot:5883696-Prymnesium_polylepis.1